MSSAVEKLTSLVDDQHKYDVPHAEIKATQIEAVNERFQDRKDRIKLLGKRASDAQLTEIRSMEDMVHVLFPHTAYKSYPERFLLGGKWDKLSKWLATVSPYPIPDLDYDQIDGIDDWVEQLEEKGVFVSCSSGTSGKSAMLLASAKDMDWCRKEAVSAYSWGSGVTPAQDRRMFGLAPVASVARNRVTGAAYRAALQDSNYEPFNYPVPPMTVGGMTKMVVLRKKIADGTATPSELQDYEQTSAERQKIMEKAVESSAEAIIEARNDKLHVTGMWSSLYNIARLVRDKSYSGKDFNPENSIYVGGGLKGAQLPADYREFVYATFNIAPERNYQNYSMQELQSGMPRCQQGQRYHIPPWVVPLILDKSGDNLLPVTDGEYEGRAAFFDLSLDGRWGGVISGDKVSIDFSPCACGAKSPSIRDNIARFADLEGDDKIGCAGTVDAYVRGVS
jgi:hypothetical protein